MEDLPEFESLVSIARAYERKQLTQPKRRITYQASASDSVTVEMRGKDEMDYGKLLEEVQRAEKIIAAAYYEQNVKNAPLPQTFTPQKVVKSAREEVLRRDMQAPPAPQQAEQAQAPAAQPAPQSAIPKFTLARQQAPEAPSAPKPPPTADIKNIMDEINSADDQALAKYAQRNDPDLYENFNLGAVTPSEFRMKARLLMAKKAGVQEADALRHLSQGENPFQEAEKAAYDEGSQ
jgi:hypothetical protein